VKCEYDRNKLNCLYQRNEYLDIKGGRSEAVKIL